MAILVPTAGQVWNFAGPIVSIGAIIWFWRNGERLIHQLFPQLEWEQGLGWLNLSAHRRAENIFRWVRYVFYLFLLASLVGTLALGYNIGERDTETRIGLFTLFGMFVYFGVSLCPWIYFFVQILGPRIKAEFEEQELACWREEHPEADPESKKSKRGGGTGLDSMRPRRF